MIIVALAGVSIAERVNILPPLDWPSFLKPIQNFLAVHAVGSLAMTYVIGAAGPLLVGLFLIRKYPLKKPEWSLFKSYFNFALPIALMSVIGIISVNIDKIMIGYFWTATEVGYYFTIQQIIQFLTIIYMSVGIVLFPALSEHHASNNFKKLKQTTLSAERYISMVMVPPIILIIIYSRTVIDIMLSSAFLPASFTLIILTFYTYLYSRNTAYGSLMAGINRPDIIAKVSILICGVNIILNYLFIPKYGLIEPIGISGPNGAAVATVISILVGFIAIRIATFKLIKIHFLERHTPLHLVAGAVMAFSLYFFGTIVNVERWYHLIIFGLIGLAVYLFVLVISKEINKKDFYFFLDVFHIRKMVDYIKYELNGHD
jgi:O-antigen/teichoic acid export membrane protein